MPELPSTAVCPKCGRALSPDGGQGLCARCVLAAMFDGGPLAAALETPFGSLLLPRSFGAYELLEEVARGGMGIVFKARQPQINRMVAVKVLASGQFASPDFVKRFRTEAEAVASLDHPNIVPVYEVGEYEGQPFFSMKFVEGGSLAERISKPQFHISERQAAILLGKLARAVHYAHQRGILHRDIKPGNVLLDAQGEPQLTDFGLAKLVEKESALTRTRAMLGTPSYMAPEQARGEAKQLTTVVDVYGLGAVFYELLTGLPPFVGGTTLETVRQVLEKEPRRPSMLQPGVDPDLETICLKCLEKDPARRYPSADALAADLERWREHEPILARPASTLERITKWIRRHRIGFLALVAIVLLLLAGATVSTWQAVRAINAEALATQRLGDSQRNERRAQEARQEADASAEARRRELIRLNVAAGNKLVDDGDAFLGLLQFVEALRLEEGDALREDVHRRRIAGILRTSPRLKQFWMHVGSLATARFHPDGRRVVYGDEEGNVQVFDTETGAPLLPPIKVEPPAHYVWFTRDGKYLVHDANSKLQHREVTTGEPIGPLLPTQVRSAPGRMYQYSVDYSLDGRWLIALVPGGVRIFTVPTGEPVGPLLAATSKVTGVRFSPDGRMASICGENPALQIVEVPSGRPVWTLPKLGGPVPFSVFSPDGQWVTTTSANWQEHDIWDVARGERIVETIRWSDRSRALEFSPDGRWIALGGSRDAQVIDAHTGRTISERMKHGSHITQFEFSSDGKQLATPSFDRTARVWDAATGQPLIPALRHTAPVFDARFSPDGARLLTADSSSTARLWDLRGNGGERLALGKQYARDPQVRLSPDGRHILVFSSERIDFWDPRSGHLSFGWKEAAAVTAACFSPDGRRVALATSDGRVQLRELETDAVIFSSVHDATVRFLEFSPDGQRLLTAGDGVTARVWNAADGAPVTPALLHAGPVRHAAFSPDGRQVLTGSDKTVLVWDVKSGATVGKPIHLRSRVMSAALSADGSRILIVRDHIAGNVGGTTQLWDGVTRLPLEPERLLLGPGPYPAAFGPDGRRYLMLHDATTVAICDVETGRRTAPLLEHKFLPSGFVFSPNGRLVLTRADRFARVWDAETGEPVSPPLMHEAYIISADWSPDGREIVTCVSRGKIRIWDVSPASSTVAELTRQAELMAAHRLDPLIGTVPLTPIEIKSRWREQRR